MAISKLSFGLNDYDPPFAVDDADVDRIKLRSKESHPLTHNTLDENFANLALKINALINTGIDTITITNSKIAPVNLGINNGDGIVYSDADGVIKHADKSGAASGYVTTNATNELASGVFTGFSLDDFGHLTGYKSSSNITLSELGVTTVTATNVNATTVKQDTNVVLDEGDLGFTTSHPKYKVQQDSSGNLYVNVPWTDTTYGVASTAIAGYSKLGSDTTQTVAANEVSDTASRTYAIQHTSDDQMVVNVPWSNTNTNKLTTFQLEDGDGTEVTVGDGKEIKFVEGGGININWTDTSHGSNIDPYDMTFTLKAATATALGGVKVSFSNGTLTITT